MAEIRLEHVTKRWGKVIGVSDLSIKAADGEFLTLLGPSGCGKSTALNIIAGLERPTEGNVYIGDKSVNDLPPKDRDVSMVFQSYAIYPHMTVRENMAFPLKLRKCSKEEIKQRIGEAAEILKIESLLDRKPKELSGGQRQRVALGRAIVRKPTAFLMDEPLSNLDAKLRTHMRVELKKLHERLGKTTVYVTHDQAEAMTMADRVVLLKGGVVQQVGPPTELYDRPKNMFVAGFLGSPSMNFIDGVLKSKDGRLRFESPALGWDLPPKIASKMKKWINKPVILGIRPEDLSISDTPKDIEARVYVVEPMGSELLVTLAMGDERVIARTKPTLEVAVDQKVGVTINPKRMHLFDGESENTIV